VPPWCSSSYPREGLYKVNSDLSYMRGELRRDQCMVLVQTGHIRSAGTGEVKPNAKTLCTGLGLKSGVW
jgi:hypothetical protein